MTGVLHGLQEGRSLVKEALALVSYNSGIYIYIYINEASAVLVVVGWWN